MTGPTAIGLLSGGLDSILACRVIQDQGIDVVAYHFISPFFGWEKKTSGEEWEIRYREEHGIEVRVESAWPEYLEIVREPRFGHGKNMNPCIDCKIFMLRKAAQKMKETGAAFVFTGEVVGQRPMSQRRDSLNLIEKQSGLKGYLVRPLSARLLPPTIPEEKGILDRDRLYDFSGRTRKPQMALAEELGITDYPSPAGGCCLTEPNYSKRLRELLGEREEIETSDVELLKLGRHFRLGKGVKLVVGRNHAENEGIASLAAGSDLLLMAEEVTGPTALLRGPADEIHQAAAAGIVARYADRHSEKTAVAFTRAGESAGRRTVPPSSLEDISLLMI